MDSLIARSEYAALDSCVYLNQAALGLIPTRSMSAMLRFMSEVAQYGNLRLSDDYELRVLDQLRLAAASLLGTPPASVAITGPADQPSARRASDRGGRWSPAVPSGEQGCSDPVAPQIHRQHGFGLVLGLQPTAPGCTVVPVKILQIAPALHGAQMQSTEGSSPVVVWALVENDDGSEDVIGLAVGSKGDRALIPPDPGTFESYRQSG